MTEIPEDIMVRAEAAYDALGRGSDADAQVIASAILAERRRCVAILRENHTVRCGEPAEPMLDELLHQMEAGQ